VEEDIPNPVLFAHKETMNDDLEQTDLEAVLAQCWSLLARGKADRRHGFHHPVVSNVGENDTPRSRVVILRAVDAAGKTLRFHTDVRSTKWTELSARPKISVLFYDEGARVQVRVDGETTLHHDGPVADAAWASSQRMSRVCYGISPGPGVAMQDHDGFSLPETDDAIARGRENFGAVLVHVQRMEWLSLKALRNRRAWFDVPSGFAGWLVP
jgi:pyridoxamine 5'-phosphate oxidase